MNFLRVREFLPLNNFGTNAVEKLSVFSVSPAWYLSFDADLIGKVNLCWSDKRKKREGLVYCGSPWLCGAGAGEGAGIICAALCCTRALGAGAGILSLWARHRDSEDGQESSVCVCRPHADAVDRQECDVCVCVAAGAGHF